MLDLVGLGGAFDAQQLRAILQRVLTIRGADGEGWELDGLVLPRNFHNGGEDDVSTGRSYRNDGLVFIENVEFVDLPKGAFSLL